MRALPATPEKTEFTAFNGGLDVVTPALLIPPGFVREAQNYEQDINGGYKRILGYERFSGQPAPSDATYAVLTCTITGTVAVGDILTDSTGAVYSGTVVALPTGQAIFTKSTGTWPSSGNLYVSTDLVTIVGTFAAAPVTDGASTTLLHAQYRNLAADAYRDDIYAVGTAEVTVTIATPAVVSWTAHGLEAGNRFKFSTTGSLPTGLDTTTTYYVLAAGLGANSLRLGLTDGGAAINTSGSQSGVHTGHAATGSVRGVWIHGDTKYAFRNDIADAVGLMFKATATGWTKIALGREVYFTAGNGNIADGQTVTETTGGEAATIARVVVESGKLASGTAAGRLILTGSPSGSEFEGGAATTSGGGTLTLTGASTAITIVKDGSYEFVNHNFTGSGAKKMYGVNGVSRAFEFDGTTYVPIRTGMTADTPSHIVAHKQHLFLSFAASVQHSAPGYPYVWSVIVGASEIAMGDTITGFQVNAGGNQEAALTVYTRNSTATLYGSSILDWRLIGLESDTGGIAGTMQRIGTSLRLDDRGLASLQASDIYGNFASSSLSTRVQTWLRDRRATVTGSCVVRDKNQYRLFFSSGAALFVTMQGQEPLGMMPQLFTDPVVCVCSGEISTGEEESYFGAADGFVYQLEKGTSFDGDSIEAKLHLVYDHSKSPRVDKKYSRAVFEVSGEGYATFGVSYELGYGTTLIEQPGTRTVEAALAPGNWDTGVWDTFVWDGAALLPTELDLDGHAVNISIKILSNSDYYQPTRLTGVIVHFTPLRQLR